MLSVLIFLIIFNTGIMLLGIYNYKLKASLESLMMIIISSLIYAGILLYVYIKIKNRPKYYNHINVVYETHDI